MSEDQAGIAIRDRIREALGAKGIIHLEVGEHMGHKGDKGRARITAKLSRPVDSIKLVIAVSELTGYFTSWLMLGKGPRFYEKITYKKITKEEYDEMGSDTNAPSTLIIHPEYVLENRLLKLDQFFEEIKQIIVKASQAEIEKGPVKTLYRTDPDTGEVIKEDVSDQPQDKSSRPPLKRPW